VYNVIYAYQWKEEIWIQIQPMPELFFVRFVFIHACVYKLSYLIFSRYFRLSFKSVYMMWHAHTRAHTHWQRKRDMWHKRTRTHTHTHAHTRTHTHTHIHTYIRACAHTHTHTHTHTYAHRHTHTCTLCICTCIQLACRLVCMAARICMLSCHPNIWVLPHVWGGVATVS